MPKPKPETPKQKIPMETPKKKQQPLKFVDKIENTVVKRLFFNKIAVRVSLDNQRIYSHDFKQYVGYNDFVNSRTEWIVPLESLVEINKTS